MRFLKIFCGIGFLVVLISNIVSISAWTESRGVYDDICYLRQAHLFQQFGPGGLDTDISRDDDRYLSRELKEIEFPDLETNPPTAPCHTPMPATSKLVMQYPPGTGLVLALFPSGFQVIPLYVLSHDRRGGLCAACALPAPRPYFRCSLVAAFGDAAIYLMINPTKASYSMAPTMMVCALAGFLTARLFLATRARTAAADDRCRPADRPVREFPAAESVSVARAIACSFLVAFLLVRNRETFLQGLSFGVAFLVGICRRWSQTRSMRETLSRPPMAASMWRRRS